MNNYRNFKFAYGGETPDEFAAARQQYYANASDQALQSIQAEQPAQPTIDTSKGKIIRNHDSKYDYYKVGNRLYTRRKGTDNWIDISDNTEAKRKINDYLKPKSGSSSTKSKKPVVTTESKATAANSVKPDTTTYNGGTLNDVVVTGDKNKIKKATKSNSATSTNKATASNKSRVQGATSYHSNGIPQLPANYNKPRINDMLKTAVANRDTAKNRGGIAGWFMSGIR